MMLITLPFFMPLVQQLGVDPIWFGVLFLICMQLGLLTPPFGLLLFTMKGVAPPGITMNDVFQAALPYVWFGLLVLVMVFFFPPLATWLPRLIGVTRGLRSRRANDKIDKSPGGSHDWDYEPVGGAHRRARRWPHLLRRRVGAGLADAPGDDDRALRAGRQHRPGRPVCSAASCRRSSASSSLSRARAGPAAPSARRRWRRRSPTATRCW